MGQGSGTERRTGRRKIQKQGFVLSRRLGESCVIVVDGKVIERFTLTRIGDTRVDFTLDDKRANGVVWRSEVWEAIQLKQQSKEPTDGTVENKGLASAV